MGNSGSTRKISIHNEDPASVIKVSESVVQRLKGNADSSSQDNSSSDGSDSTKPANNTAAQEPVQNYNEPSKTSLQVRREKEAEIRNNDTYWERRLAKLQESHNLVSRKMEEEYESTIREMSSSFTKSKSGIDGPPCQDVKAIVVKCYKENPNQALMCAKEVEEFAACVDMRRRSLLTKG